MLVQHLFLTMREIADRVIEELPPQNEQRKEKLDQLVQELSVMSETILEEWIKFEELFDTKIRPHFSSVHTSPSLQHMPHLNVESHETVPHFIKAQGYYNLGMYEESYPYFVQVVNESPDEEAPRIYLAYTCLFLDNLEEALKHFTLLQKTTSSHVVKGICLNALGNIAFKERDLALAQKYFQETLEVDPTLFVAHYNLGIVYYIARKYRKAISAWEQYLTYEPTWDFEIAFYLVSSYLKVGEYAKALHVWKESKLPFDSEHILIQFGQFFEEYEFYTEAAACYQDIVTRNPRNIDGLHGLAWNLWLGSSKGDPAIPLLKKALSLQPDHLSVLFSLAWIYFHLNEQEETEHIIKYMFELEAENPLALSLSFLIALKKEDWEEAERLIVPLKLQKAEKPRALGEMFYGRLKLSQHKLTEAIEAFKKSIWNNPQLKESHLLQGLAYFLNQEPDKAEHIWNKHFSVIHEGY